ncbi:MAG: acetylxylan esterase [Phycisphaerales bacterium]|nr:acetylxylan esterase [Phycisphaerales bacterium]
MSGFTTIDIRGGTYFSQGALSFIKMRSIFISFVVMVASSVVSALAATPADTLYVSEASQREAGQMLLSDQRRLIVDAYKERDRMVDALQTPDQIKAWATKARAAFIQSMGGLPEKCPLDAKYTGRLQKDGYTIDKVLFQSRPDFWVSAHVYLPDPLPKEKIPGIIAPMGHSAAGKESDWYQDRVIGLVRQGFAVVAYDQVGLGERWQYFDPVTKLNIVGNRDAAGVFNPKVFFGSSTTNEHDYIGAQLWLTGDSLMQCITWDGIRAIDFLVSLPQVDPDRIGCTGASMGGTTTTFVAAVDPRLKVAIPVSYVTRRQLLAEDVKGFGMDAEQVQLATARPGEAWEEADLLLPMALHGGYVQIGGNIKDFFPIAGTRWAAQNLSGLYAKLGMADHFHLAEVDFGHGWSVPMYEANYKFLHEAFGQTGPFPPVNTSGVIPLKESQVLWTTPAGQVTAPPLNSLTLFDLNRQKADELGKARQAAGSSPKQIIEDAVKLSDTRDVGVPQSKFSGSAPRDGYVVEKYLIQTEAGIQVPALLIRAASAARTPSRVHYVYASPDGKQTVFDATHFPLREAVNTGASVLAIDVRGWGETRWRRKPDQPPSPMDLYAGWTSQSEEHLLTCNELRLGRTLVGSRATDMLASARWLRQHLMDGNKSQAFALIYLWGEGELGVAAIHAVAANPAAGLEAVAVRSIFSYDDWVHTRIYDVPMALIIPGILKKYDLPELAWAMAKTSGRPVVSWIDPVDAQGLAVDPGVVNAKIVAATPLDAGDAMQAARVYAGAINESWRRLSTLSRAQQWILDLEGAKSVKP